MNWEPRDPDTIATEDYPCAYCGQPAGARCVTVTGYTRPPGQPLSWPHEARRRGLSEARSSGYFDGHKAAYHGVAYTLEARIAGEWWAIREEVPLVAPDVVQWVRERAEPW